MPDLNMTGIGQKERLSINLPGTSGMGQGVSGITDVNKRFIHHNNDEKNESIFGIRASKNQSN